MAVTRANVTLKLACDARPALKALASFALALRRSQLERFWAQAWGWRAPVVWPDATDGRGES